MVSQPAHSQVNEFNRFRDFLFSHSGITLADNKHYLVDSRLKPILQDSDVGSIDQLLDFIDSQNDTRLVEKIVDAMTTNETFWFRDTYFYDYLESSLLPELLQNEKRPFPLRVWSAASSSGQEAYSFSIAVERCIQALKMKSLKQPREVEIIGSDISKQMVQQANNGVYSSVETSRGLPDNILKQYFDKQLNSTEVKISEKVKRRATFRVHNLQSDFSSLGLFEVVLCRNVLIYFDSETVKRILLKIHSVLRSGGVLFLSASETLRGLDDFFEPVSTNPGFMYRVKK